MKYYVVEDDCGYFLGCPDNINDANYIAAQYKDAIIIERNGKIWKDETTGQIMFKNGV